MVSSIHKAANNSVILPQSNANSIMGQAKYVDKVSE